MVGTNFPALPGGSRGRDAAVRRAFADRQRFAAVLAGWGIMPTGMRGCRKRVKGDGGDGLAGGE
jgi:hypothetical protein